MSLNMINIKIWKKKIGNILISKYFFISIILSIFCYFIFLSYSFVEQKHNNEAFTVLFDLQERYKSALTSTSMVPMEELHNDIIESKKKLKFFCTLNKEFTLLEAIVLIHLHKLDEALLIINSYIPKKQSNNEIYFLYQILQAYILATNKDINKKQEGLYLLKEYSKNAKYKDVALFYYGYLLRKTASLKEADEIWAILQNDPVFNNSPYKKLIEKARNCDF